MRDMDSAVRKSLMNLCRSNGFTKKRNCFYRCTGDGLLQVIKIPANSIRSKSILREDTVYVGIFSLFSEINWIHSEAIRLLVQADLPITASMENMFSDTREFGFGHGKNYVSILEKGIAGLSEIQTHAQMACFLEEKDRRELSSLRWNDSSKIVPYLLSGHPESAIRCIDAIEQQNWAAYSANLKIPSYDQEKQKKRIEESLNPLITLREQIRRRDGDGIRKYLREQYSSNADKLRGMGIPAPELDIADVLQTMGELWR